MEAPAKRSRLYSFLALAAFSASLSSAPAEAKWKYRVTPHLKQSTLVYFDKIPGTADFRAQFNGEINAVYRWKKNFKVVLQPVGAWDPSAKRTYLSPIARGERGVSNDERYFFDLREGYMQLRARPFTFTLGNQIFSWGVADGFSPTDVVNPRRYVSPLSTEKLGAPAATIGFIQGDFDLELIYIPHQRRSIMPGEDSRWLPRSFYVSRAFEGYRMRIPQNVRYFYVGPTTIDHAEQHNYGGRLRGQLGGLDLGLIYFEGQGNSPAMNVILTATTERTPSNGQDGILALEPDFGLRPVYFRKRTYGGTLVYTLGEFIIKGESAFTKQISTGVGRALPGDYQEHSLGLEHDFPAGDGKLTAILEGTHAKYETPSENGTTSLSRVFERALALGLRYAPTEQLSFVGTVLLDTKNDGSVYVLNGDYKIRDNLGVNATVSVIDGVGVSPLATYRKNDLAAMSLRYDF